MHEIVTEQNIKSICTRLSKRDEHIGRILKTYGVPPLWDRDPTFATLVHIILEQQVSLASVLSAFNRLRGKIVEISPENILELTDTEMRSCYFSRQKMGYARNLADAIGSGSLDLENLHGLHDQDVKKELKKIKGIGDWTADIYLLMAMLRKDVMPKGDLALHSAYQKLMKLEKPPKSDEFVEIAKKWKPYRSVAARLLWHFYLSEKEKNSKTS